MKIISYLCAILFVLAASISLIVVNINGIVFNKEKVSKILEQSNTSSAIVSFAAESLAEGNGGLTQFKGLPSSMMENLLNAAYPPADIQIMVNDSLGNFFDYINNESDSLSVTFALAPLQQQLTTPEFRNAMLEFLSTQPLCTNEQRNALLETGLINGKSMILCSQPGSFTNEKGTLNYKYSFIEEQLIKISENGIPKQISLIDIQPGTKSFRDPIQQVRGQVNYVYITTAVLLLLLSVAAIRSAADWLKWWGWPLIATGVIGFAASFILPDLALKNFNNLMVDLPQAIMPILIDVTKGLLATIFDSVKTQAMGIFAAGLVMVAAGSMLVKRTTANK